MNSRRTVILIVAVVVAALAAVGLLNYVKNAESSAGEAAAPVDIWVVKQPIPKGTPIDAAIENQLIGLDQTAQKFRPATAVENPEIELAGLVAVVDLAVDTPVLTSSFVSPNVVNTGITDRLEERGLVTVTFDVGMAEGAAYLIEPGDFVNVITERTWDGPFFEQDPPVDLTEQATAELLAELEKNDTTRPLISDIYPVDARYVYQKAEVLAIGDTLVPDIGQTEAESDQAAESLVSRSLVTLAVPPEAVQVILNVDRKSLYLSLVPDDYEPRPLPPLDPTTQVLPGEVEGRLTPYDGYEGVVNPGLTADELLFADPEDRIGTAPNSGSTSSNSGSSSGDTADSDTDSDGNPSSGRGVTTTTAPEGEDGEEGETTGDETEEDQNQNTGGL